MIGHDDPRLRDRDGLGRRLAEAAGVSAAVLLAKRAARDVTLKSDGSPVSVRNSCSSSSMQELHSTRNAAGTKAGERFMIG